MWAGEGSDHPSYQQREVQLPECFCQPDAGAAFIRYCIKCEHANTFQKTYEGLKTSIDNQRSSVSGVDKDEEAVSLVKYQNSYTLASKMIQTLTEIYDQLILNTGVWWFECLYLKRAGNYSVQVEAFTAETVRKWFSNAKSHRRSRIGMDFAS